MRVLYAAFHPLPVSESYIRNEIEWMEKQGVEIGIWARHDRLAVGYPDEARRYWIGNPDTAAKAIAEFKPDFVHAHPLFIGQMVADVAERAGVPLTIRGHVGFTNREPGGVDQIRSFASRKAVSRVWTFPHIAADVDHPKVHALPATYSDEHFVPGEPSQKRFVLRIGTALPAKGWEEFIEIARRCPNIPFVAAMAIPHRKYADRLAGSSPKNLTIHQDLQREECVKLMQSAWVYLRGHEPGPHPAWHRYGMPISIAEALGCGLPIIARENPDARQYIGLHGIFYGEVKGGAEAVRAAMKWTKDEQRVLREKSIAQSALYRSGSNFPRVLQFWESHKSQESASRE